MTLIHNHHYNKNLLFATTPSGCLFLGRRKDSGVASNDKKIYPHSANNNCRYMSLSTATVKTEKQSDKGHYTIQYN
jgi:hypothetical protein